MMKPVLTLKNTLGHEIYSIFDDDGVKSIHIHAYMYRRDTFDDLKYALVEGTFVIVPLAEFVENYRERESDYVDNVLWAQTNQYQEDMNEEDFLEMLASGYVEGGVDAVLPYADLTVDTPYGNYLS